MCLEAFGRDAEDASSVAAACEIEDVRDIKRNMHGLENLELTTSRENIERRRRNRKDAENMALLRHEYDLARRRGHYWTKDSCRPAADRVGLSVNQVYKWGWDQRKKEEAASKQR